MRAHHLEPVRQLPRNMQIVAQLTDLPFTPARAVIINCGTKWVTSLALASVLANTDCPVLVIDCESKDGSAFHFERLARSCGLDFHWLRWPLRTHPDALDALFRSVPSDFVLLVDSDVELLSRRVFAGMTSEIAADASAYGAGFLHGPAWMGPEHGLPSCTGYYAERMWIPLVLLRTASIRRVLRAGCSFANRRPFLEIPGWPRLSHWVGYRYRIRGMRHLRVPGRRARHGTQRVEINGQYPAFVEYDTGADLHRRLQQEGHSFARLPEALWGDVRHCHGVTRAGLAGRVRRAAISLRLASMETETEEGSIVADIRLRLSDLYGVRLPNE
jgi:hypothetical protein